MPQIEAWSNHTDKKYIVSTTEAPLPGCSMCGKISKYHSCWVWWSPAGDHIICDSCYKTIQDVSEEYIRVRKATRMQAQLYGP